MTKLKMISTGLAALVLVLVVVIALQPSDFRIARSIKISAPAADVFSQVNDFHNWEAWDPWAKLDPTSETSFEGEPAGKGTIFKWSGNDEVGAGTMTITESRPNDLIKIRLAFEKPFKNTCQVEFTFEPEGDQTLVTWSMSGEKNFFSKAICLVMSMEKMVGGKYEEGLAKLKKISEAPKEPEPQPVPN